MLKEVELGHTDSSSQLSTGDRVFIYLLPELTGVMLLMTGDVPIENEAPVLTSSTSQSVHPQSCLSGQGYIYAEQDECVCVYEYYLYLTKTDRFLNNGICSCLTNHMK